jgi:hypothetical protein
MIVVGFKLKINSFLEFSFTVIIIYRIVDNKNLWSIIGDYF